MRLFRHILLAAALPLAALLLGAVFAPDGPPSSSAASGVTVQLPASPCHRLDICC